MPVPLTALSPQWCEASYYDSHGARQQAGGRHGMGLMFRCPLHYQSDCAFANLYVPFHNPVDGGPKAWEGQGSKRDAYWTRTGETFETLTLSPSIKMPEEGPEHWHGHVINGQAVGGGA